MSRRELEGARLVDVSSDLVSMEAARDRLGAGEIRALFTPHLIGREILVLEETRSTNDFILQMATPQVAAGLVVLAEYQTAGRGQHGRRWESARGEGLWLSILLRPPIDVRESARLTDWAAHATARAAERLVELPATVKAPNDVYLSDRKIAGVLVEMRAQGRGYLAIIGIGLNVNQLEFPPEIAGTAASLRTVTGRFFERNVVAARLLTELDRSYAQVFRE